MFDTDRGANSGTFAVSMRLRADAPLRAITRAALFALGFGSPLLFGGCGTESMALERPQHIVVDIDDDAAQKFHGFGVSQPFNTAAIMKLDTDVRDQLLDLVYTDMPVKFLRLWSPAHKQDTLADMKANFRHAYIDSGLLSEIEKRAHPTLLLAPGIGGGAPEQSIGSYADKLAKFIRDLKDEDNVVISVTGIANEPLGYTPQQIIDTVKALRRKLNQYGLPDVKIIAPEAANVDTATISLLGAMKADAAAWQDMEGMATHSYNMGANDAAARLAKGKEYWMTEAGQLFSAKARTDEEPGDKRDAATVAGRFLSDMNHGVTHWFWFIGIGARSHYPNGLAGHSLVRPGDHNDVKILEKYYYLQQLLDAFNAGAVFHRCSSSLEGTMIWGHGLKPAITVAAAQNPDGSWTIGVVNATGLPGNDHVRYHAKTGYVVTIKVPKSAKGPFLVTRLGEADGIRKEPDRVSQDARRELTLKVSPLELITLRSAPTRR